MKLILCVVAGLWFGLIAEAVSGCTCPRPADVKLKKLVLQAVEEADAVFSGEVIEIIPHLETKEVRFAVLESWKGVETAQVTVESPIGESGGDRRECSFPFEVGKTYLVYASGKEDELQTNTCFRTNRLKRVRQEVKILRRINGS